MTDDSESGILARLRRALRAGVLVHVPDHPAHGGNTGDAEWTPGDPDDEVDDDSVGPEE